MSHTGSTWYCVLQMNAKIQFFLFRLLLLFFFFLFFYGISSESFTASILCFQEIHLGIPWKFNLLEFPKIAKNKRCWWRRKSEIAEIPAHFRDLSPRTQKNWGTVSVLGVSLLPIAERGKQLLHSPINWIPLLIVLYLNQNLKKSFYHSDTKAMWIKLQLRKQPID